MGPVIMDGERFPKGIFPVGYRGALAAGLNWISSF